MARLRRSSAERKRKFKRIGNAGVSLAEIIIAITIFAIVAVPVCQSLTTSMVYNGKARIRQSMTLKGESIMETFKGNDLETIQGWSVADFIGKSGIDCTDYDVVVNDVTTGASTFTIKGIQDGRRSSTNTYTAEIEVTSNGTENVLEMKGSDSGRDAVFTAKREYDTNAEENAYASFAANAAGELDALKAYIGGLSDEALYSDGTPILEDDASIAKLTDGGSESVKDYIKLYDRTLEFVIKKDSSNYVVTAKMTYRYYIENYPYYIEASAVPPGTPVTPAPEDPYPEPESTPGSPVVPDPTVVGPMQQLTYPETSADYWEYVVDLSGGTELTLYNDDESKGLDRLIIYYYPQYDLACGSTGGDAKDNIVITMDPSASISDFSCYILKQCAPDLSPNVISVKEGSYTNVSVAGSPSGSMKLYHNFYRNISDEASAASAPGPASITGFANGGSKGEDYLNTTDLYDVEVLSYNMKLVITNDSTGGAVTRLESTKNEKIK